MLAATGIIIFGIFFFIGIEFAVETESSRKITYSISISLVTLLILTLFEVDTQYVGFVSAMSGIGFFSGFTKGSKAKEIEFSESFKSQSLYCKYCKNIVEVSEDQLLTGNFICPSYNSENRV